MSRKCEYCDSVVPENVSVCPYCCAKLETQVIQSAPAKKTKSAAKTKAGTGQKIVAIFLSLLFVGQSIAAAFFYPGFLKSGGKKQNILPVRYETELTWTAQKTDSAPMPETGEGVTVCGVTVRTDPVNLSWQETVTVTDFGTQTDAGEEIHRYEVELGEHRQFEVPVEVSFPCMLAEDEDVAVLHYVEETGKWIPLAADYDAESGTVTAYFSSLSPTEVRKEKRTLHGDLFYINYPKNEAGIYSSRNATVEISSYYWSILKAMNKEKLGEDALKYTADPALYAQDFERYKDDYIRDKSAAFNNVNDLYGKVASSIDLYIQMEGPILSNANWSDFGEALGTVSLLMAAYQLYDDYQKAGDVWKAVNDPTLLQHLYTNICTNAGTIFSKVTGYSSAAFSAGFIVVGLVAVGLDKAVQNAKDEMKQRNADIFNSYFKNVAPFNKNEWYEAFRDAYYKSSSDPDRAMAIISEKIDRTVESFWTDIYKEGNLDLMIAAAEADTKNYFTKNNIYFYNVSEEQKAELNKQMKWAIWKQLKKEVMPLVNRFLVERMQESVLSSLAKFSDPLNRYMEFEIFEQVPDMNEDEYVCKYPGCTLAFGVKGKPIADWTPITASEDGEDGWRVSYNCTVIGWHEAGCPDCVLIYESEQNLQNGKKPLRSVPFTFTYGGVTEIDVTEADGEMVWALEKVVFCPSYSDEAVYFKTNISAGEDTYFGISHECEYGCDFTVRGMAPGKILHKASEFSVGFGIDGDLGINCPWDCFTVCAVEDAYADENDENSFGNSSGGFALKENGTLYGESAVSRIECAEGNTLVMKINGGEIEYHYRAMPENEAITLKTVIVEREKPVHIPNAVVFPAMNVTLNEQKYGEVYGEVFAASDLPYTYETGGQSVTFSLGSNGDFTIRLPALNQYTVLPAITVTGNVFDGDFFDCGVKVEKVSSTPKVLPYEQHWKSGDKVEICRGVFTHTNRDYRPELSPLEQDQNVSYCDIDVEDGKLIVEIYLYGVYSDTDYNITHTVYGDLTGNGQHPIGWGFEAPLSAALADAFTKACDTMADRQFD
ncbi:MAG: hypothetical protein MJ102_08195 [Clostridia bacterium]|nr:hypothetical protein [Clostridia bacterium]